MLFFSGRVPSACSVLPLLGLTAALDLTGMPLRAQAQVESMHVVITPAGQAGQTFTDMVVVKEEDPPSPVDAASGPFSGRRPAGRLVLQRPLKADLDALAFPPGKSEADPLATYLYGWDHAGGAGRQRTVAVQLLVAPTLGDGTPDSKAATLFELDYKACAPLKWSITASTAGGAAFVAPAGAVALAPGVQLVEQLDLSFESVAPQAPKPFVDQSGNPPAGWNLQTNSTQ